MILITGGAGYIGSAIASELHKRNEMPLVFDIVPINKRNPLLLPCQHIVGNVCNTQDINAVIDKYHPDTVFHLAAKISIQESERKACEYFKTNVIGTLNVLESMRKHNCRNIIFASSAAVYRTDDRSIDESFSTGFSNIYGMTKLQAEEALSFWAQQYGIHVMTLRLFNVIGKVKNDTFYFTRQTKKTNLLSSIQRVHLRTQKKLTIFGNTHTSIDGFSVRDYVHVEDVALAFLLARERIQQNTNRYECFNIGSGLGTSVLEFLRSYENIYHTAIPHVVVGQRPGDVGKIVSNPSKAKNVLGWQPNYYSIESIIASLGPPEARKQT